MNQGPEPGYVRMYITDRGDFVTDGKNVVMHADDKMFSSDAFKLRYRDLPKGKHADELIEPGSAWIKPVTGEDHAIMLDNDQNTSIMGAIDLKIHETRVIARERYDAALEQLGFLSVPYDQKVAKISSRYDPLEEKLRAEYQAKIAAIEKERDTELSDISRKKRIEIGEEAGRRPTLRSILDNL